MAPQAKIRAEDFTVNLGQEEVCRILDLKENLNNSAVLEEYISRYLQLGWSLVAVDAQGGADLGLDFRHPQVIWAAQLADLSFQGTQINLAVRSGKASQLLVLEVNKGEGALALDQGGDWRAECVAGVGDCWEQHYYLLPSEIPFTPSFFQAPQVLIYGEGGRVLVPPSLEPQGREPWRWLKPPWERPPRYPKPAVWQFLKKHLPSDKAMAAVPTWAEIYQVISPHGMLLKALLVPAESPEAYCQNILSTALGLGLREPPLLLGLLWHAPHLDTRTHPEIWEYLQDLVARALGVPEVIAGLPDLEGMSSMGLGASALINQAMGSSEGSFPGFRQEAGTSPPKYDQSVSGQFFQLLAGLGEKVIMECCRYEAILSGFGRKAGELEDLVAEWERGFPYTSSPGEHSGLPGNHEPTPIEFDWSLVIKQQVQRKQQLLAVQAAACDFLEKNSDLAADRDKVQMVLFCLKNYVSLDPEWAALSFREKLERAGTMARDFLREQRGP